ncbi:MAG: 8-amino-7-oxononanoate synthase [Ginsengibacter sp.]
MNEYFLQKKLEERKDHNALRMLKVNDGKIDFCSNDYLGIVKNKLLETHISKSPAHGSTGSRLLSGNYPLIEKAEKDIADFHNAEAGLIFNSGYDANLGLIASVAKKGDVIIYDQLSHASIRDGCRLSFAESFSFAHNDITDLTRKLDTVKTSGNIFVITESVFSMDGDMAPLVEIAACCEKYNVLLIVDEAHATGVIGGSGEGLAGSLTIEKKCFARIHTFGKAVGAHGAIVLGSGKLKTFLINFARPFIYSTALPPATISGIVASYQLMPSLHQERKRLNDLIAQFHQSNANRRYMKSDTPIQGVIIPGNKNVRQAASLLQENNFDVRPILYPTVPEGKERLRIVLHSFNSTAEVAQLLDILKDC